MADKPKRRWFQFRLRTLLVGLTVAGTACALVAYEVNRPPIPICNLRLPPQARPITDSPPRVPKLVRFEKLDFGLGGPAPHITLYPNGDIEWVAIGRGRLARETAGHGTINKFAQSELRALISAVNWNDIKPEYGATVLDAYVYELSIQINTSRIKTTISDPKGAKAPKPLLALANFLYGALLNELPPEDDFTP